MYGYRSEMYAVNEFAFLMMWAGENNRKLSVTNVNDVLLAVKKAYNDMSLRTITGLVDVSKDAKDDLKVDLANEIVEHFF